MAGDGTVRAISDLFSRLGPLGAKKQGDPDAAALASGGPEHEPIFATKALRKFLTCLTAKPSPVLLDLGPVVGPNVTFFGEQLGCKIIVEDIFAELDRHAEQGTLAAFPEFLKKRFQQGEESVDGILCWDLIDYLDRPAAQVLAAELARLLRVDGALLAFFATAPTEDTRYTKYIIQDEANLRHRGYRAARGRQRVLLNRDIIKLFEGLRVSDSFLLQTNLREILFRKPAYLGAR